MRDKKWEDIFTNGNGSLGDAINVQVLDSDPKVGKPSITKLCPFLFLFFRVIRIIAWTSLRFTEKRNKM